MLAGAPAFSGDSTAHILSAILRDEPRPLKAPALLERIVRRCLAKDPAQRFQSMGDLAAALQQAIAEPADQTAVYRRTPLRQHEPRSRR